MESKYAHCEKIRTKTWFILLTLFLLPILGITGSEASNTLTVNYQFKAPQVSQSGGYHSVIMEGLENYGSSGLPVLPYKTAKVLLPCGEEITEMKVLSAGKTPLAGTYLVEPGKQPVAFSYTGQVKPTSPDPAVYGSSAPFPARPHTEWSVQCKQGYQFVMVNLYPVEYVPAQGLISYYPNLTISITTTPTVAAQAGAMQPNGFLAPTGSLSAQEKRIMEGLFDNPDLMSSYPIPAPGSVRAMSVGTLAPGPYEYVIITSQALENAVGGYTFQDLVAHKISKGVSATIVTTEWIYANYDGARPDGGQDNQTRIRNFITDAYKNWGTKYVLLGGDADGANVGGETGENIVPVRNFYGYYYDYYVGIVDESIPADMYYACLDGTFDYDADGWYGEAKDGGPVDGPTQGNVDLFAEVYVGRAPVDSDAEVSNFVGKTIAFENGIFDRGRKKALILGEDLYHQFTVNFGCDHKDEIRYGSCNYGYCTEGFPLDWEITSLCDRDNPYSPWNASDLIPLLDSGTYLINHLGHADVGSNMRLINSTVDGLTNTQPFVAYSQGCYSGSFDNRDSYGNYLPYDSVAEHLVTAPGGAAAVLMNSRFGWGDGVGTDGPSQRFDREFFDAYFGEWIFPLGMVNQDSKEDNAGYINEDSYGRWCAYAVNLLGDPQTPLGNPAISAGLVYLDREIYLPNGNVGIILIDSDLNADPAVAEQHTGLITLSAASGDVETGITLTETEPDSSRFTGTIVSTGASAAPNDGILQVDCFDTITADYHDADDGTGRPRVDSDTAATDCVPPVITSVAADAKYIDAVITWTTDEPSDSKVLYGTTLPLESTQADKTLIHGHTVILAGLTPSTRYYYVLESTDEAGNVGVDDNNGKYYQFTTMTPVTHYVPGDYPSIQTAIDDTISFEGNQIVLRPGVYSERIDFMGKAMLIRSEGGPGMTILEGGAGGTVVTFKRAEGAGSVLQGLTITNGRGYAGGGIYIGGSASPKVINCIISDNLAFNYGGGIFVALNSMPTIVNTTISNNYAKKAAGGIFSEFKAYTTLRNSIVWGNAAPGSPQIDAYNGNTIAVSYSNIQGGWAGTGNLACNPEFLGSGDYHLLPSSCCVDAGTSEGAPNTDIDGDARPQGNGIDVGADEYKAGVGRMALDRKIYPFEAPVGIVVLDSDLNTDPASVEQYAGLVTLTTTSGDQETGATLTETGTDTGVFELFIPSSTTTRAKPADGLLQIECGIEDIITATYVDADNGAGIAVTHSDTARTDCYEPVISNLVTTFTNFDARLSWDTNEGADTYAIYGTTNPPDYREGKFELVTSHEKLLANLTPNTTYYYAVDSTDQAGNRTVDDNNGQYYQFTTPPLGIHYVPDDYPTIQAAIDALSTDIQNVIIVRAGTYVENINFRGKGVVLKSESGPESTIIDGGGLASVVTFKSNEGPGSVLRGFTLTNGAAAVDGGGILCSYASPTIDDCIITSNRVKSEFTGYGAGIAIDGISAYPTITNSTITQNKGLLGAGITSRFAHPTIANCTISDNVGVGMRIYNSQVTITHSTISNNSGTGIDFVSSSMGEIINSVISHNAAAGINCQYSSAIIANCMITDNRSTGLYYNRTSAGMVVNSTISNNAVGGSATGGGIACFNSSPTVVNSIVWGNTASGSPSSVYQDSLSSIEIVYSDVQGGWSGTGNVDLDPLFVGGGNYHLTMASPCIDAGTDDAATYTHLPVDDIDGQSRPQEAGYDMGADELFCTGIEKGLCADGMDNDCDGLTDCADTADCGKSLDCMALGCTATEGVETTCNDGIDNDCDKLVDAADPDCPCEDADGDTYAVNGGICGPADCDDGNPNVFPGAPEICGNSMDENCDGKAEHCTVHDVAVRLVSVPKKVRNCSSRRKTVRVEVSNPGEFAEQITVTLTANRASMNKAVSIDPGSVAQVSFAIDPTSLGAGPTEVCVDASIAKSDVSLTDNRTCRTITVVGCQ